MPAERQEPTRHVSSTSTHVAPTAQHTQTRPDAEGHTATLTDEDSRPSRPRRTRGATTTLAFRQRVFPDRIAIDEMRLGPQEREKRSDAPERKEHILLVDDEAWITDVIYEQLSIEGFTVSFSNTSAEVMGLLEENTYDLILLDIYMPPPDGFVLLNQIREKYPFLPIIMLTAFSDANTASRAMREGAYDYIVKPHQTSQLVSRIERALERGQLLRERAQAQELLEQRVEEQTEQLRKQSKQLSQMLDKVLVTYQATLKALEATLDVRDQSSPGHCRRVSKLAVQLGTRLGVKGNDLIALEHGALLHDIGKLGISDAILLKPGPLTSEEWTTMRKHPEIGCDIVGHIEFLQDSLPIIRHHHEHFDGSGYPDGLQGQEIPFLARIFAIVDVYDALTNQRPYNKVLSIEQVLRILQESKGKQFDPQIVDAFREMILDRSGN
jgi:putative nucleotidyltransferase with HDIG domain